LYTDPQCHTILLTIAGWININFALICCHLFSDLITTTQRTSLPIQPTEETIRLPWIQVAPDAPYFVTQEGIAWTPIGHNDAITWPGLAGLYKRKDIALVDAYLARIAAHGTTCLRLMLEYCQTEHRYLERPAGVFNPHMLQVWDDLFGLCAKHGIRVLLTPFDTFWMRRRWRKHPYNYTNGGPCSTKYEWLVCAKTIDALKNRLAFATQRWGGNGVLFAWDLWNEVEPIHANGEVGAISEFITEISSFLRDLEIRVHGKSHLQSVSAFAPHLNKFPALNEVIFRHPLLDFATTHFYGLKALDMPTDTVKAALSTGNLVAKALNQITDNRPFFDSEHGPIRAFRRRGGTLPQAFDEEYFRYMQWAHLASGGAGGGMRWPYRHPHTLTRGMQRAQQSMTAFCKLVDWTCFNRRNLAKLIKINSKNIQVFACGNSKQVIMWLLQTGISNDWGMSDTGAAPVDILLQVPVEEGSYQIIFWHTQEHSVYQTYISHTDAKGRLMLSIRSFLPDIAVLIKKIP
jgi:mannan endo-1,4-beta-mannosidase